MLRGMHQAHQLYGRYAFINIQIFTCVQGYRLVIADVMTLVSGHHTVLSSFIVVIFQQLNCLFIFIDCCSSLLLKKATKKSFCAFC